MTTVFTGTDRIDFVWSHIPPSLVGAEIGVWTGNFAARLLHYLKPSQLYLIDPWASSTEHPEALYGVNHQTQDEIDKIYDHCCKRFEKEEEVKIIRDYSHNVLPQLKLDWVYLDGDHSYEAILSDLNMSLGCGCRYIAGDDYGKTNGWCGDDVRKAVKDFVKDNPCELLVGNSCQFLLKFDDLSEKQEH